MSIITTIASGDAISASRSVINTNFSNLNTDKAELSGGTFTGDISVPAEVYGAGWNGSNEVPTKNDLYDKIETKQDTLVSGTNIKTVNGSSVLGSGDLTVSGGASTFLALTDTPSSYTGQALKIAQVNAGETALEFITLTGGGNALTTNPLSQFASTTSAQLAGVMSDETGTGALVFANSPALVTPSLGVATATSINGATITSGTLNGSVTGTNTGDQTTIVGITGTKAQFDTACTDDNFMYVGTVQNITAAKNFFPSTFGMVNVASTIISFFSNTATIARTWTFPDKNGTVAMTSDITGTNSGTNTGDETTGRINTLYGTSNAFTAGSIELGHATDTTISRVSAGKIAVEGVNLLTTSSTETVTNKRVTKRVETVASSATPASNTDSYDITKITGLAVAITSLTSGLTGTPVDGDMHLWSFTDNGTARAITPGASFENSTVSFPTTTVISTRIDVLCEWNTATSKWRVIATS